LFKEVFLKNKNWALLLPRLIKSGFLNCSDEVLKKILALAK